MIIKEDGRKIKLLLDLTEEMIHTMKAQHPEKVYFGIISLKLCGMCTKNE